MFSKTLAVRFYAKVLWTEDNCWEWTASVNNRGRPVIGKGFHGAGMALASHASWFLHYGSLPAKQLNHHCDNALCVNPLHMYEGTQLHNIQDHFVRRTNIACPRGHARIPENTQIRKDGSRYCKVCQNEKRRERRRS